MTVVIMMCRMEWVVKRIGNESPDDGLLAPAARRPHLSLVLYACHKTLKIVAMLTVQRAGVQFHQKGPRRLSRR